MGVRFTVILSGVVMVCGGLINWYAVSNAFEGSAAQSFMDNFMNLPLKWWNITPFYDGMPASAKLSAIGFMCFGCGVEMAGITVSRGIVKWFKGKEMALAMGVEMAIARIRRGRRGARFAPAGKSDSAGQRFAAVLVAVLLLCIGLISFIAYAFMDKKLENQMGESGEEKDDPFKVSDLGRIFSSKVFWIVALLCVLYYSAIFPFQKYAINMLQCNLKYTAEQAGLVFFVFPLGAAAITPFLGNFLDRKGKGATMLILGAVLMICCHLTFAFILPATQSPLIAYAAIILLGISFSLVPAALWPQRTEAGGKPRARFGLCRDFLDSEHRTLPVPHHHRPRTFGHQPRGQGPVVLQLYRADAHFRQPGGRGLRAGALPESHRPQETLRTGAAQHRNEIRRKPQCLKGGVRVHRAPSLFVSARTPLRQAVSTGSKTYRTSGHDAAGLLRAGNRARTRTFVNRSFRAARRCVPSRE